MTRNSQQLETHLWGAATLSRGTIDAGDYKQRVRRRQGLRRPPRKPPLPVPADAHWREASKAAKNVSHPLQSAICAVEIANPDKLYGIFGDAQWTKKDRLP